jgi:hypothetical protein
MGMGKIWGVWLLAGKEEMIGLTTQKKKGSGVFVCFFMAVVGYKVGEREISLVMDGGDGDAACCCE